MYLHHEIVLRQCNVLGIRFIKYQEPSLSNARTDARTLLFSFIDYIEHYQIIMY